MPPRLLRRGRTASTSACVASTGQTVMRVDVLQDTRQLVPTALSAPTLSLDVADDGVASHAEGFEGFDDTSKLDRLDDDLDLLHVLHGCYRTVLSITVM